MKNSIYLSVKAAFLCCSISFMSSCSQEPISEPEVNPLQTNVELSGLSSYTVTNIGCSSSSTPNFLSTYSDYINVGNGKQAKTLRTKIFNTDTHVFVEADYLATAENENLPGQVTIDVGGTVFEFHDVKPGETVEAEVPIPGSWFGSSIEVFVRQKVFLEPAEVQVNFFIAEPCPLELGAELKGGIVGYLLQPGDDGYIEGESHGIIVSSENIGETGYMTWSDAMASADSLDLNGYDDWTLPSGTEAIHLLSSLSGEFDYDPYLDYGYWTAMEVDETRALAATMMTWSPSLPPTIETSPSNKSNELQVRVVRRF